MKPSSPSKPTQPDYGIDAPAIMFGFLSIGATLGFGGAALAYAGAARWWGVIVTALGAVPLFFGMLMVAYWLIGKRRVRAHMLDLVRWRGDERVLDVGTGAGFLMIGAAKHVPSGHVVGLDAWSAKDLSNNTPATTDRNLAIEGVAGICHVVTGDARDLSFPNASFDVVLSLLCLHNIQAMADRQQACREIARVLKPGGRVVIGDYVPTHGYASALSSVGLRVRQSKSRFAVALSLMWILVADKPV